MPFLREGAVKELIMRGPETGDLISWSQDLLLTKENPLPRVAEYAREHGLNLQELASLINIKLAAAEESDVSGLNNLLGIIEDATKFESKKTNSHYPLLEEIEWAEEMRDPESFFVDEFQGDEDDNVPYPGGYKESGYDEDDYIGEEEISDSADDYSEASFKLDKFMPDDNELQYDYYEILGNNLSRFKKSILLRNFFMENADMETLEYYLPEGGSLEGFIEHLLGPEENDEEDEDWVDPAGGIHSPGEDPAAMYEALIPYSEWKTDIRSILDDDSININNFEELLISNYKQKISAKATAQEIVTMSESLNEEAKKVYYIKPAPEGYSIWEDDMNIMSGAKEDIMPILTKGGGLRVLEVQAILNQLDSGRKHVSVILNPYVLGNSDLGESIFMESLEEAYGNSRVSFKKFEDDILIPLAEKNNVELKKGKIDKFERMGKKVVSRYYGLGPVTVMVRDTKVVGMGSDDVEPWILDPNDPTKGSQFNKGWDNFKSFKEKLETELGETNQSGPEQTLQIWNKEKINKLISELREGASGEDTNALFDIISDLFREEDGLEDYIQNQMGIEDAVGWFVNQL